MTKEEAIKEIKSWDFLEGKEIEAIQTLIPELAENEDERIRKEMIEFLNQYKEDGLRGVDITPWISYLEKQKEQKQPKVDLDEEINRFWDSCIKHKNERGGNVIWSNKIEIEALARYFYELGLNTRKEECHE